jgi:2-oxo-4-hydroxy-4-carboxy--5-ureidoimidazoline (OHCU) decarboxylase
MVITVEAVNVMDFDDFVETFGNIVEHSALLSAALWTRRPFTSVQGPMFFYFLNIFAKNCVKVLRF